MKISDVVTQIRTILPKYTNRLGDLLDISDITVTDGNLATITTSTPHNIPVSHAVTLADVKSETSITGVSQDGLVFTFTTAIPHDLTLDWQETVNLIGFTDTDWNNSFDLVSVPSRLTFSVRSTNTMPTLTASENLLEVKASGVNGSFLATVIDTTSFSISGSFDDGGYQGGQVSDAVRVSGVIDIDRAIEEYTKQTINDLWLFVAPVDAEVSKDRNSLSDAISSLTSGAALRMRILDGFNVYVVGSTVDDISGVNTLDLCRHDLLLPILKTLFGTVFTSGLTGGEDFKTVFAGHGINRYNRAVLVYEYEFQVAMDLTGNDAVEDEDTRAYRDIDYFHDMGSSDTTDTNIDNINLDGD